MGYVGDELTPLAAYRQAGACQMELVDNYTAFNSHLASATLRVDRQGYKMLAELHKLPQVQDRVTHLTIKPLDTTISAKERNSYTIFLGTKKSYRVMNGTQQITTELADYQATTQESQTRIDKMYSELDFLEVTDFPFHTIFTHLHELEQIEIHGNVGDQLYLTNELDARLISCEHISTNLTKSVPPSHYLQRVDESTFKVGRRSGIRLWIAQLRHATRRRG